MPKTFFSPIAFIFCMCFWVPQTNAYPEFRSDSCRFGEVIGIFDLGLLGPMTSTGTRYAETRGASGCKLSGNDLLYQAPKLCDFGRNPTKLNLDEMLDRTHGGWRLKYVITLALGLRLRPNYRNAFSLWFPRSMQWIEWFGQRLTNVDFFWRSFWSPFWNFGCP